mgnify:CR=1 FL=1
MNDYKIKTEPIRILHVVTHLNRNGLESRIMDIYRNIDRTKIQFDFMIHRNDKGDFGEEIEQMGGKIYFMQRISPKNFISYCKQLDAFFKSHQEYKIVHSHLNTLSTWVLLYAKKNGIPVRIAHSRNANMERDLKAIPKQISKLFINCVATDRFGCSKMAGEWLFGKKYANGNTFKVIPNAFQVDKFTYDAETRKNKRCELGIKDDEVAIVDIARLSEQKNHIYLLKIFEEILKINKHARLYLVGTGECEYKIKDYIALHNLNNYVKMLGSRSDVAQIYQAADLFLFPSKYEGFGTVLIEAQITNLPTVASSTIPHETKLCDCVEFMPINVSPKEWANKAIQMIKRTDRKDNTEILQKSGFDIRYQYKFMQDFYTNYYKSFNSR